MKNITIIQPIPKDIVCQKKPLTSLTSGFQLIMGNYISHIFHQKVLFIPAANNTVFLNKIYIRQEIIPTPNGFSLELIVLFILLTNDNFQMILPWHKIYRNFLKNTKLILFKMGIFTPIKEVGPYIVAKA